MEQKGRSKRRKDRKSKKMVMGRGGSMSPPVYKRPRNVVRKNKTLIMVDVCYTEGNSSHGATA